MAAFFLFFLKCRFWKATGLTSSRDNDAYTGSDVLEHLRSWEFWFLFMHSMPAPPGKPAHLSHGRVGIPRDLQGLSLWQDTAHRGHRMTSTDLWTFFLEQGLAAAPGWGWQDLCTAGISRTHCRTGAFKQLWGHDSTSFLRVLSILVPFIHGTSMNTSILPDNLVTHIVGGFTPWDRHL